MKEIMYAIVRLVKDCAILLMSSLCDRIGFHSQYSKLYTFL